MIWLFRYLKGYLYIEISGENAEQLLNVASKNRISLWNLRYTKGKIIGCVSFADFYRLRIHKRKLKIKIKIIKKCGLPLKTARFKKRAGLLVGAIIFFVILKFLSGFIWCVEVEGNKTVKSEEIHKICTEIGVREGAKIKNTDAIESAQNLLLNMPSLAWASVNIEGCRATVNVTEIKDVGEDTSVATNIKAGADGEIIKISATSGTVCVKVGDIVKKGDLLVSGVNEKGENGVFVHSSGIITAKVRKTYVSSGNFNQKIMKKTDEESRKYVLDFFTLKIPLYLGQETQPYVCTVESKRLKLFGCSLPVSVISKKFQYCNVGNVTYTEEELTQMLKKANNESLENECKNGYTIIEEKVVTTSDGIRVETIIETIEDIAVQEVIIIN